MKRIMVFPPNGGEGIEISEDRLDLYESRGWTSDRPKSEPILAQIEESQED